MIALPTDAIEGSARDIARLARERGWSCERTLSIMGRLPGWADAYVTACGDEAAGGVPRNDDDLRTIAGDTPTHRRVTEEARAHKAAREALVAAMRTIEAAADAASAGS